MPVSSAMSSTYDSEMPGYGHAGMDAATAGMYATDPHRAAMSVASHPLSHSGLNHGSPTLHQPYPATPYSSASSNMGGVMPNSQDAQIKRDKDSIYSWVVDFLPCFSAYLYAIQALCLAPTSSLLYKYLS